MISFGVVLTITNPLSSGYLPIIAAIQAWSKISNKILIIDGGSDDGSVKFINNLIANGIEAEVISNYFTNWGKKDNWNALQLLVNLNIGLQKLNTDWAFAFSSDYIPYKWDKNKLENELKKCENKYWVRTYVGKPINDKIIHKYNTRNILFNLKKIREDKLKIGYGIDKYTNIGSDFPIIFEEKSFFIDPVNKIKKTIFRGSPVISNAIVNLECIAYGHFFYTEEQLEYKIQRWDRAFSRFLGIAPARLKQLLIWHNVPRGRKYYSKEEILKWDHPKEIKEVIEQYYKEGMIGGIIDEKKWLHKKTSMILFVLLKIERKIRTFYLKIFKDLRAEKDDLKWEKI